MSSDLNTLIEADGIRFGYGNQSLLGPLSMRVCSGDRISIVRHSGGGKTTLLYLLAGILEPTVGRLFRAEPFVHGSTVAPINFVFQSPDLIPWLTVHANVLLPLRLAGIAVSQDSIEKATMILSALGLEEDREKFPKQLSGGMKKRVGLARVLIINSRVVLMDEPFSELDEALRRRLMMWLDDHLLSANCAAVLVTHSIEEAITLSSRVVVLTGQPGRIAGIIEVDRTIARLPDFRQSVRYFQYETEIANLLARSTR